MVIDLKIGAFEAEFSGKMHLYLNAVDATASAYALGPPEITEGLPEEREEALPSVSQLTAGYSESSMSTPKRSKP